MKNILQEQNIERDNLAKFDPFGYNDRERVKFITIKGRFYGKKNI